MIQSVHKKVRVCFNCVIGLFQATLYVKSCPEFSGSPLPRTNQSFYYLKSNVVWSTIQHSCNFIFVYSILFYSKCIFRQKKYLRKKAKKLCLMGPKVTAFWKTDRTINVHCTEID